MGRAPGSGRACIPGFYDPETPPAHGVNRGPAAEVTQERNDGRSVTALAEPTQLLPEARLPVARRGHRTAAGGRAGRLAHRLAHRYHPASLVRVAVGLHLAHRFRHAPGPLLLHHPADRVWLVAHPLLGHPVGPALAHRAEAGLLLDPASLVRDVADLFLAHVVAVLLGHVLDALLGHHPTDAVRDLLPVRLLDRVAVLARLVAHVLLFHQPADRVRHGLDVLLADRVALPPRLTPLVLFIALLPARVRVVADLFLAHVVAVLLGYVLDVLLGDDAAGRVRDVAHLLFRDRVALLLGDVLDVLFRDDAAGRVRDVADVLLGNRIAAVPGLVADVLLLHHPAGRVALLAVRGVALGPAHRHLHRVRVWLAHLLADLDLLVLLLRHPHLLARPGPRGLDLLADRLSLAVARLAGARVDVPVPGGLAAARDDRARAILADFLPIPAAHLHAHFHFHVLDAVLGPALEIGRA